jgi:hypothetical protein
MAETAVVTKQLEIAGYKDIKFEQVDAKVFVGNDLDDAVGFQLAIGPAGEVYREAGKLAEERHDEIAAALRAQLAKYKGPDGVMMESSSWKVTASNPRLGHPFAQAARSDNTNSSAALTGPFAHIC